MMEEKAGVEKQNSKKACLQCEGISLCRITPPVRI